MAAAAAAAVGVAGVAAVFGVAVAAAAVGAAAASDVAGAAAAVGAAATAAMGVMAATAAMAVTGAMALPATATMAIDGKMAVASAGGRSNLRGRRGTSAAPRWLKNNGSCHAQLQCFFYSLRSPSWEGRPPFTSVHGERIGRGERA